jgi:hypothetical protein
MSTRLLILFSLGFIPFALAAQPRTYQCMRPSGEIIIDGNISEWDDVAWTDSFTDISGEPSLQPYYRTRVKMLWDTCCFYIAAELEEQHLWASITERDEVIFYNNDFEVFIDPDGDTHNYAEIEVNALGTIWDLFLTRPYRDGTIPLNSYDIDGLLCRIRLQGSLNDPADTDTSWTLEMAIPWKAMAELTPGKRKPYAGEYWRINFSRVQWEMEVIDGQYVKQKDPESGKTLPENNWVWSPQGKVNMHMPEKWGYVFFSDEKAHPAGELPDVPADEGIRMLLRELYHAQKAYYRLNSTYARNTRALDGWDDDRNIQISASGSQYSAVYEDDRNSWRIDQHGKITHRKKIKCWIWMHGNGNISDSAWSMRFQQLSEAGIDGILLGGSNALLRRVIPLAKNQDIEVHAWRWMLNCNKQEVIDKHPEWYSVSREGYSCLEKQPYVGYYKWLCPARTEVREYLRSVVRETISIDGLAGFHMDYIRHPDVILPRALWEKYGLVQDHEMPEYDYCYCEVCRKEFNTRHGYDILESEHPEEDSLWRQFRYDIVSELVNGLEGQFRHSQKQLTAAVFPSPGIARRLVRQDWDHWNSLSAVFPMVYHNFYNEDLQWIGETTWSGVHAIDDRIPLYTGLYVPSLTPGDLQKAVRVALEAGASGISLFDYNAMTEAHWEAFTKLISQYRQALPR